MDLELSGKRVLVTGASRGIGYACARHFAREGCEVTLASSNEDALRAAAARLKEETGTTAALQRADLSTNDGVESLRALATTVDILVNNAGAIPGGGLADIDSQRWRESWNLEGDSD
jgi:3-oxoacyl-[acyl-carrier protein] reductase